VRTVLCSAVGEIEMNADPKSRPSRDNRSSAERARKRQEDALDEALKNTFPASDPISVEQPAPHADRKPPHPSDIATKRRDVHC
jgi:hypothetical protein